MGATLLQNGLIQFSGIITAAEVNALGSAPYNFLTPAGFVPISFGITVLTGTTPPVFTDRLVIFCPSNGRAYLATTPPQSIGFYNFAGITAGSSGPPNYFALNQSINVEPEIFNNLAISPGDFTDPTPGDYEYRYILAGYILQ